LGGGAEKLGVKK